MDKQKIATIELEVPETSELVAELIYRLDDGNDFPGFEVEKEGDHLAVYSVN